MPWMSWVELVTTPIPPILIDSPSSLEKKGCYWHQPNFLPSLYNVKPHPKDKAPTWNSGAGRAVPLKILISVTDYTVVQKQKFSKNVLPNNVSFLNLNQIHPSWPTANHILPVRWLSRCKSWINPQYSDNREIAELRTQLLNRNYTDSIY